MRLRMLSAIALAAFALPSFTQQATYVLDEDLRGTNLRVEGELEIQFYGLHDLQTWALGIEPTYPQDELKMEWVHTQPNGKKRKVTVSVPRPSGRSVAVHVDTFFEQVQLMQSMYPPDGGPPQGATAGLEEISLKLAGRLVPTPDPREHFRAGPKAAGDSKSVSFSWMHDPDKGSNGNGPLTPMKVTVTVEKRKNESTREMLRRLKQTVEKVKDIYPPNVEIDPGPNMTEATYRQTDHEKTRWQSGGADDGETVPISDLQD